MTEPDKYETASKVTRRIINYVDPEGFNPGKKDGAPVDEYEIEIAPIAEFIAGNFGAWMWLWAGHYRIDKSRLECCRYRSVRRRYWQLKKASSSY